MLTAEWLRTPSAQLNLVWRRDLADQSRDSPKNRLIDLVKSDSLNISLGGVVLRRARQ